MKTIEANEAIKTIEANEPIEAAIEAIEAAIEAIEAVKATLSFELTKHQLAPLNGNPAIDSRLLRTCLCT